ncbi:MAG TPA: hypothetical protein PK694_00175 [Rhodospirillales bacterium]|nr:hypothetical protein [Rhodospirillales bacterium]
MLDQQHGASGAGDGRAIWRFLDFAQFVDLLERKSLFFARIDTLEDPFAGLSEDTVFAVRTLPEELMRLAEQAGSPPPKKGRLERWWSRKAQENEQAELINTIRNYRPAAMVWASCWHATGANEVALWKTYQAAGKCVAVRTSIGKLRAALNAGEDLAVSVDFVRYLEPAELRGLSEPIDRALTKAKALASEREVRAIVTRAAGAAEGCLGRGVCVPVDVAGLIDEVAISPAADEWLRDLAGRVLRTYGLAAVGVGGTGGTTLALPDYRPERALPSS